MSKNPEIGLFKGQFKVISSESQWPHHWFPSSDVSARLHGNTLIWGLHYVIFKGWGRGGVGRVRAVYCNNDVYFSLLLFQHVLAHQRKFLVIYLPFL